jgi:hypothetical protein
MKLKTYLAALALCVAVPLSMAAAPSCDRNRELGGLAPSGPMGFSSSFSSEGTYRDYFTFSLASQADSLSGELQPDNKGIDLQSVALYRGDVMVGEDSSPLLFSFGSLAASGDAVYTLQVVSDVTEDLENNGNDKVKKISKVEERNKDKDKDKDNARVVYIGTITTVSAPVPEPAA